MKKIVIVGGGTAGLAVLKNLHRRYKKAEYTIIEPSETHYYQPLWTLVGGGVFPFQKSQRNFADFVPDDVRWEKDYVAQFFPEENVLELKSGKRMEYDVLVVAAGIQLDWHKIEGLEETLGKNGVTSNYSAKHVSYTWQAVQECQSGRALFTQPNTPIKCAGAPQKIMYMAEEDFRKRGLRDQVEVHFASAGAAIFGVQKYRDALEKIVEKRDIQTTFQSNLVKIDGEKKIATFENIASGEKLELEFAMIHVVPQMSAPDFIKQSPLANAEGWVDVDQYTLQHKCYANVFSLGDASGTPNSKTGAAIRRQGPVLTNHVIAYLENQPLQEKYNGYASCPLITGRGKCILAEFDYDGQPDETFFFDQAKERLSMYLLKKYFIPFMYWNAMMKGYF
tara:strand:- start:12701 stop:13879 length:1179 start_codon:yes stop_codon:yes gene_type:complete